MFRDLCLCALREGCSRELCLHRHYSLRGRPPAGCTGRRVPPGGRAPASPGSSPLGTAARPPSRRSSPWSETSSGAFCTLDDTRGCWATPTSHRDLSQSPASHQALLGCGVMRAAGKQSDPARGSLTTAEASPIAVTGHGALWESRPRGPGTPFSWLSVTRSPPPSHTAERQGGRPPHVEPTGASVRNVSLRLCPAGEPTGGSGLTFPIGTFWFWRPGPPLSPAGASPILAADQGIQICTH